MVIWHHHRLWTSCLIGAAVPALVFKPGALAFCLITAFTLSLCDWEKTSLSWRQWLNWKIIFLFLSVAICWGLSSSMSLTPMQSWAYVLRSFGFTIMALQLWLWLSQDSLRQHWALKSFLIATSVTLGVSALALTGTIWENGWISIFDITHSANPVTIYLKNHLTWSHSIVGIIESTDVIASTLVCMLPVLIIAGIRLGSHWLWLAAFNALTAFIFIIIAGKGAPFLGILIAALVLTFHGTRQFPKLSRSIIRIGLTILSLSLCITVLYQLPYGGLSPDNVKSTPFPVNLIDPQRQQIWAYTLLLVLDNPLLGLGPDTSSQAIQKITHLGYSLHPHNWLLEVLSETGIFGLIALVNVLAYLYFWLVRRHPPLDWAILALISLWWGAALCNFSFWSSSWQNVFLILMVLAVWTPHLPRKNRLIGLGSDHAGYRLKQRLKQDLTIAGIKVHDVGTDSLASVDYPDQAHQLAQAMSQHTIDKGILICGSGIGMSMAANRHPGVRAALCYSPEQTILARQHNDANILTLGERAISYGAALSCVEAFLSTNFTKGRHTRRVKAIDRPKR